jgi:O-antigen ligase
MCIMGARMAYVKILSVIAFIGSLAWFIAKPGYEPGLAVIGSIAALLSAFIVERRNARSFQQDQSVSESSVGIQAGGDISIGTMGRDKHAK